MARGSIVPKGPAKHMIRVYLGTDPETRQRKWYNEVVKGSTKDAEQRLNEVLVDSNKGAFAPPSKLTLTEYLKEWLRNKEGEIRARTAYDYRGILARYVFEPPKGYPRLELMQLRKLEPRHFTKLFRHMAETCELSHRTVTYLRTVLSQALKDAVAENRLSANPVQYSKVWKRQRVNADIDIEADGGKYEIDAMTQEQADRFLEAASTCRYHALWAVLLLGGLRPSEAFGLKWDAIDLESGDVHVRQTLTTAGVDREEHPEGWVLTPTKTSSSRRTVTLPRQAVAALRRWKAEQARERLAAGETHTGRGFVFSSPSGEPVDASRLYDHQFRPAMERAGLGEWRTVRKGKKEVEKFFPSHRVYDLRHTHATLLLAAGEDVKVVSERLGHKNVQITYDYYVHVLPAMKTATAARLEAMFGG